MPKKDEQQDEQAPLTQYQRLCERFEDHHTRRQGGQELLYVTGEQVISRLNDVLGVGRWSWKVIREGTTASEAFVLGELTAQVDDQLIIRQHYGNQDLQRGQHAASDLFKSANTDALKKAATTIGVALYLYDADERREIQAEMQGSQLGAQRGAASGAAPTQADQTRAAAMVTGAAPAGTDPESLCCEECGELLTETRFKDGQSWAPAQLAVFGRRKHSRILCMSHYREANQAKRRAEEALQQVPF